MPESTKPEVFIIESLNFEDEKHNRFEGRIISQIMALSGKACEYYYIRTEREFQKVLKLFSKSQYRYLHLSCHGDTSHKKLHTTLDCISFDRLSEIMTPYLGNRRLFVSACAITNVFLGKALMPNSSCYSIMGPDEDIGFNDAAILWASLYHVLLSTGAKTLTHSVLLAKAQEVANMYRVHLTYIQRDNGVEKGYSMTKISPHADKATGFRVKGRLRLG